MPLGPISEVELPLSIEAEGKEGSFWREPHRREAVGTVVVASVFFQPGPGYMGGTLNLSTLVVTPPMTGEDLLVVDNAHLVEISEHGELAPHVGMGDGIIIQIETDIRRLAGGDGHPLPQLVGVAG